MKKLEDQITEIRNKHKEKYYREHLSKLPTTQTNQQKTTPDENATSPEKTQKVKKKINLSCWRLSIKWYRGKQAIKIEAHTSTTNFRWKN